jgi:hypothetical protein
VDGTRAHWGRREGIQRNMKERLHSETLYRWETIITRKIHRKEIGWDGLGLSVSVEGKVADSCVHGSEHSESMEILQLY